MLGGLEQERYEFIGRERPGGGTWYENDGGGYCIRVFMKSAAENGAGVTALVRGNICEVHCCGSCTRPWFCDRSADRYLFIERLLISSYDGGCRGGYRKCA